MAPLASLPIHPDLLAAGVALVVSPPPDLSPAAAASGLARLLSEAGVAAPLVPLVAEVLVAHARLWRLPRSTALAVPGAVASARVALMRAQASLLLASLPEPGCVPGGAGWEIVSLGAASSSLET